MYHNRAILSQENNIFDQQWHIMVVQKEDNFARHHVSELSSTVLKK
jgi:hypothetical protein